jgi:hypothetical protein
MMAEIVAVRPLAFATCCTQVKSASDKQSKWKWHFQAEVELIVWGPRHELGLSRTNKE